MRKKEIARGLKYTSSGQRVIYLLKQSGKWAIGAGYEYQSPDYLQRIHIADGVADVNRRDFD